METQFKDSFMMVGKAHAEEGQPVAKLKYTENGKRWAQFWMNRPKLNKAKGDGSYRESLFRVTAWEEVADKAVALQPGQVVEIRGYLNDRVGKNQKTGLPTHSTQLVASFIGDPTPKVKVQTAAQPA